MTAPEILARKAQHALFASEPDGRYKIAVEAKAPGASKARVQVYGVIGDWWDGLDAATLATQITALEVDEIEVHLNSPGGIAFDGVAIYNALRQHDANVHVLVDGLAASAASIIAMAGNKITMATGSQMMIHDASGLCFGQAADMAKTAEVLDKISSSIADVYADHAGGTRDEWRQTMLAETWYTAAEAVEAGLADAVGEPTSDDDQAGATNAFDLSIFAYAGRDSAPAPHIPPARPAESTTTSTEGAVTMTDTLNSGLRERLGITAELDEGGLLAALDEALKERAEPTATLPNGTVAIEQATLDNLRAAAQQGQAAREQQLADQRHAAVDAAVADGRIAMSRREDWVNQLKADPGSMETLNSLAKGLIPVAALGYTGGPDESTDDERAYEALFGKEA